MEVIKVKSVSQYGDIFMMKFDCSKCGEENFSSERVGWCDCCRHEPKDTAIDVSNATYKSIEGTRRRFRFSKKIIQKMHKEQDGKCAYCFSLLNGEYHLEHIKPLCVGGTNNKDNICLSCPTCNLVASSYVFDDFFAKQNFIISKRIKRLNR